MEMNWNQPDFKNKVSEMNFKFDKDIATPMLHYKHIIGFVCSRSTYEKKEAVFGEILD